MSQTPDFMGMLKDIFKRTKEPLKPRSKVGQDLQEAIKQIADANNPDILYNIHKRSLPVGVDQVIAIGFTKWQGKTFIVKHLKTHIIDSQDGDQVIYYDLVRQDGKGSNIYHNDGPLLQGETNAQ